MSREPATNACDAPFDDLRVVLTGADRHGPGNSRPVDGCPALTFLVLRRAALEAVSAPQTARVLRTWKRAAILRWALGDTPACAPSKASVRLLTRVHLGEFSERWLEWLVRVVQDPGLVAALAHVRGVRGEALPLLLQRGAPYDRFALDLADVEKSGELSLRELHRAFAYAEGLAADVREIGLTRLRLPRPEVLRLLSRANVEQLARIHDRWMRRAERGGGEPAAAEGPSRPSGEYPRPVLDGDSCVDVITSWSGLREESRTQGHCVADAYRRPIAEGAGHVIVARVLAPERSTVAIEVARDLSRARVLDLRLARNGQVQATTVWSMNAWVRNALEAARRRRDRAGTAEVDSTDTEPESRGSELAAGAPGATAERTTPAHARVVGVGALGVATASALCAGVASRSEYRMCPELEREGVCVAEVDVSAGDDFSFSMHFGDAIVSSLAVRDEGDPAGSAMAEVSRTAFEHAVAIGDGAALVVVVAGLDLEAADTASELATSIWRSGVPVMGVVPRPHLMLSGWDGFAEARSQYGRICGALPMTVELPTDLILKDDEDEAEQGPAIVERAAATVRLLVQSLDTAPVAAACTRPLAGSASPSPAPAYVAVATCKGADRAERAAAMAVEELLEQLTEPVRDRALALTCVAGGDLRLSEFQDAATHVVNWLGTRPDHYVGAVFDDNLDGLTVGILVRQA